jgi:hypothetical protein
MKPVRLLINGLAAAVYSYVFTRSYAGFLNPVFEYAGYVIVPRDATTMMLSYVIATLPALLWRGNRALSSALSAFVYIALYIPIILTFPIASNLGSAELLLVQMTFLAGMCVVMLADVLDIELPSFGGELRFNLRPAVLILTLLATVYIVVTYRGNLRLVSFGEAVYEQRFSNVAISSGFVTRYVSTWLVTLLAPLCLAYGIVEGRIPMLVTGVAACVVLYMATAEKATIMYPVLFGIIYLAFRHGRLEQLLPRLAGGLAGGVGLLLLLPTSGLVFIASSLLVSRALGNGGLLTVYYYDFFTFHPQTDYSHVTGVSAVTHPYPYGSTGLGNVIGTFYWNADLNANASFWATDGLAAMGLPGVLVASVAFAAFLIAMNAATRRHDRMIPLLALLPFMAFVMNQSLFSTIWSGGGLFLMLFFLFNRPGAGVSAPLTAPVAHPQRESPA